MDFLTVNCLVSFSPCFLLKLSDRKETPVFEILSENTIGLYSIPK